MRVRAPTTLDSNGRLLDLVALVGVEAQLGADQYGETNDSLWNVSYLEEVMIARMGEWPVVAL